MTDPYLDGAYRWWHLSDPSPELTRAEADGWVGKAGTAIDFGCGLGTEIAHLAASGWKAVGVDFSATAVSRARQEHAGVPFAQADMLALPFESGTFDFALDRGCFHYLSPVRWPDYEAEARRVLRPGGLLLLRACLTSQGVRNQVTESGVTRAFAGWAIDWLEQERLPTDTHHASSGHTAAPSAVTRPRLLRDRRERYHAAMSEFLSCRPNLEVDELAPATAFLRDVLGFEVEVDEPGMGLVLLRRDQVGLALVRSPNPGVNSTTAAYIGVTGVDELHQRCAEHNVPIVTELTDQPWGLRDFVIQIPGGHRLALGERIAQPG